MRIQLKLGQIDISEMAAAMEASLYLPAGTADVVIEQITDDIKEIGKNTLYILGEDNSLAEMMAAEKNGAAAVLASEEKGQTEKLHIPSLLCGQIQTALWSFAKKYIRRRPHKTVVLTGAKGKTKSGEFIFSVLEEGYKVCKATDVKGGIQSEIEALLDLKTQDEFLLIELKPNDAKEAELLAKRVSCDFAVVTEFQSELAPNINLDLISNIGADAVVIAKAADSQNLSMFADRLHTVSEESGGDLYAENVRVRDGKTVFDIVGKDATIKNAEIHFSDKESLYAALYAAEIGLLCGITPEKICSGLKNYHSTESQVDICTVGTVTLITDTSSLSADSMKSGIETLCSIAEKHKGSRKLALLGDIRDFGQNTRQLHENMGALIVEKKIDKLFTFGVAAEQIGVGAKRAGMAQENIFGNIEVFSPQKSADAVAKNLRSGDVLLVRISRAAAAEIVAQIKAEIEDKKL
ncbi:MAG: hypothetical protein IJS44_03580 [Clostridia bacterium]|nr:hypothetical protein [Clostridia bacterium]